MLTDLKVSQSFVFKRRLLNYLIAFESTLIVLLTVLAIQVRQIGEQISPIVDLRVFILILAFPIMWLCCLSLFGAWDISILDNHIDGYRRLLKASWITFLTFSSTSYIFKIQISRFVILFSLIGGTILHLILRWIFLRVADRRVNTKNNQDTWLIISPNGQVNTSAAELADQYEVKIKYFEAFKNQKEFKSWLADLNGLLSSNSFSSLVLTSLDGLTNIQINELMWGAQQLNISFVIHDELGFVTSQNQFKRIDDYSWLRILTPRINDSQRVVKRLFDLVLVIPSLILLSPLFIAIAIAIILNSRGSVLYSQQRIGQDGKFFTFPKFRTMKPGSDSMRLEVLGRPDENMAERYKNDPRITKVGRLLRRFSLDELPQLWCVLIGTMSIVGPRPILPEEEIQLRDLHFRRQIAKPGLTGIWQVSGRKDTSWEDRMSFDIKYVQEWSISLDLIIIFRTFKVLLSGKGAY
jgi:exopolysaccharide biosynthesis polyprenyl glycosylphosphotransferase